MSLLRTLTLGMLTAFGMLAFTTAAQADRWQKSSDGYWYYWSDNDQRWFYQDGKKWQVLQNGQWVDAQAPSMQSGNTNQPGYYQSYYSQPDSYPIDGYYRGYNRGYDGYWGNRGYSGWDRGRGWGGGGRGRR